MDFFPASLSGIIIIIRTGSVLSAEFDDFRLIHEEYAAKLLACGVLLDFMILPGGCHQDVCTSLFAGKKWNVDTIRKHL